MGAAVVRMLADGSAYVRVENAPGLLVPAACIRQLDGSISDRMDPGAVEAAVAQVVCSCAKGDRHLAAGISAYTFTLVAEALAPAVLAGAQACSADDTEVAAGPGLSPRLPSDFRPGGLGRGTREPCSGSPITFC